MSGREQEPWKPVKRKYVLPNALNLERLLRPHDLADDLSEMNLVDPLEIVGRKRRQLDRPTETQRPNRFGVVLNPPYSMYPHQEEIVTWGKHRENNPFCGVRGGIINTEMGTGKSLISQIIIMSSWQENQCATLVVMPKTLMLNYQLDAKKFFGTRMRVLVWDRSVMSSATFQTFSAQTPYKNHAVVVSYDTIKALAKSLGILRKSKAGNSKLKKVAQIFYDVPWHRVIFDESHRFANQTTQLWEALRLLKPGPRFCMTGTAIRNREEELFAQFKICGMDILDNPNTWTIQNYTKYGLATLVMCRSLEDCSLNLPERNENRRYVQFSPEEQQVYRLLFQQSAKTLSDFKSKSAIFANVLEVFTRLRQACIAPHLIAPESKTKSLTSKEKERLVPGSLLGPENVPVEAMVRSPMGPYGLQSAKMKEMVSIAQTIPVDDKMIIFAEWSAAVHLAYRALAEVFGYDAVAVVSGDVKDRDVVFTEFKSNPQVRFLCTTSVATEGLTLIEANHALTLSTTWNSAIIEQFYARIWRIGQRKPCFMWQLVVRGTVESRMLQICEEKHNIREILLNSNVDASFIRQFLGLDEDGNEMDES